jgi:hypothetical protein
MFVLYHGVTFFFLLQIGLHTPQYCPRWVTQTYKICTEASLPRDLLGRFISQSDFFFCSCSVYLSIYLSIYLSRLCWRGRAALSHHVVFCVESAFSLCVVSFSRHTLLSITLTKAHRRFMSFALVLLRQANKHDSSTHMYLHQPAVCHACIDRADTKGEKEEEEDVDSTQAIWYARRFIQH